jgi:very-short-patch-repair endonuclease
MEQGTGAIVRGIRIIETRKARSLREDQTRAEALLWRALRGRGLVGFKFIRQGPIGPYFADFVRRDRMLIVEIDGATHSTDEELRRDAHRTKFLIERGYLVLRIANDDVYRNLEGALETILAKLNEKPND